MQRGRPATSAAARGTASSSKAGVTTTSSARSRAMTEKAVPTAVPATSRASKATVTKAKASVVAPATRKRAPTSSQATTAPAKAATPLTNQEEQPQHEEDYDGDQGAADAVSVCSVSNVSDTATYNWLIGSDYRLVTAVRVRPMLPLEKKKGYRRIVDMASPDEGGWTRLVNPVALTSPLSPPPEGDAQLVAPLPSKQFTHEFAFDHSFWSYDHAAGRRVATQGVVYESVGGLAIETVLQGYNCAILAYGQSGTGKTFTMTGGGPVSKASTSTASSTSRVATSRVATRSTGASASTSTASRRGLTPRICRGLFDRLEELQQDFGDKSAVHMSFVEVYNEKVFDLLLPSTSSKRVQEPLKVREHPEQGMYVENARQVKAATFEAVQTLLEEGNRQRSAASSRSHAVLTLTLTHQTPPPLSAGKGGHTSTVKKSKLFLVDLAGSERSDTAETGNTRQRETSSINRSLATLADVISALSKRSGAVSGSGNNTSAPFVPYRNSVLTRLLKDGLAGDATTILLATISPCCAHFEDTLSTLKFVGRAKNALSVPKLPSPSPSMPEPAPVSPSVDPEPGIDLVYELRKEILELREKLDAPPPASEARYSSFPLALSWESPSPGAAYSGQESAFTGPQSTSNDPQTSSMVDAVADATRWALQYTPSPMLEPSSSSSSHPKLDESERTRLEDELEELKATLSRKEYEFECQRVTTRALQDRVAAQILSQHLILTNLVSIRRRWLQLQAVRAFQRWRTSSQGSRPLGGPATTLEDSENQSERPLSTGKPKRVASPSVQLDALCHSVVDDFVFTAEEQALKKDLPLVNASQQRPVDYDEAQQQAMDCDTLSIIIADGLGNLEAGSAPDEVPDEELDPVSGSVSYPDSFDTERQQYMDSKLASCLDSIDLARKAMGPTLHRLKQQAALSSSVSETIGVERSLLVNLDTRLAVLSQAVELIRDGLEQRNQCAVNRGVAATAVFEFMEALVSSFCLHTLGRMNDQLVSGVSGCALGRQEMETQLRTLREQLAQLLQLSNAVMARGELHPRDHDAVLFLVMELVAIGERIECVWLAIEQRKRLQLASQRVSTASHYEVEQMNAKLGHLESNSRALSESLDAQVLETSRVEDELAASVDQVRCMEIQLAECEARASEFEKISQTQSSTIQQLEHQLEELNASRQTLHDAQYGATTGDESSPITLRCGNLMVRLEEELTSALSRMNAMDSVASSSQVASPMVSSRASPSSSPLMKEYDLQLAAINSELSELAATTPLDRSATHTEIESLPSEGGEGELKAASCRAQELETQLGHYQAEYEAMKRSVHSLNCELSEALERVASLEDERSHTNSECALNEDTQSEDWRLMALSDAQSALVEMNLKLELAMDQATELRTILEASETDRASLSVQLAKEQADGQELRRQVETAVEHLTELRGQAGTLRGDLESALSCKQQWEAHTLEKEAVIASQAAQLSRLSGDLTLLEGELESEKQKRSVERAEVLKELETERERVTSVEEELKRRDEAVDGLREELEADRLQAKLILKDGEEAMGRLRSEVEVSSEAAQELRDQLKGSDKECAAVMASKEQQIGDLQGQIDLLRLLLRKQQEDAVNSQTENNEELNRIFKEHEDALRSKEQQVADLHGEADLLRLLLKNQQEDSAKGQVEYEKAQAALDDSTAALATAEAQLEQSNTKLTALELSRVEMSAQVLELEAHKSEITQLLVEAHNAVASSSAWEFAWSNAIAQCGALKLELKAAEIERRRLEDSLSQQGDVASKLEAELEGKTAELGRSEQANEELNSTLVKLSSEMEQRQDEVASLQEQVDDFEARGCQREAEYLALQLLRESTEQEKRRLQESVEKIERDLQTRTAEYEAVEEKHTAQVLVLEARFSSQVDELEAKLAAQATDASELNARVLELDQQLEDERGRVQALRLELETCQAATADRQDLLHRCTSQDRELSQLNDRCVELEEQIQHVQEWRNAWVHSVVKCGVLQLQASHTKTERTGREEALATALSRLKLQGTEVALLRSELQRAIGISSSLETARAELQTQLGRQELRHKAVCCQLQGDLEAEKRARQACERSASLVATMVERASQRLREVEATALMQLEELESFRWSVAADNEPRRRRRSAELLDHAVAAYSLEPSEEAKRAVMQHLHSLDEWFERTIVAGLADDAVQSSLEASTALQPVDSPSYQGEKTAVDLEALTNELLDLCSPSNSGTEPSRTDTLEAIRVLSVTELDEKEEEEDDDEKETTVVTEYEFEDVFGETIATQEPARREDNNASDLGEFKSTHDTVRTVKTAVNEPESSEIEVAQLKSTIWRLKQALDAKDDMLGFMDAKLSFYEQLQGKQQGTGQHRRTTTLVGR